MVITTGDTVGLPREASRPRPRNAVPPRQPARTGRRRAAVQLELFPDLPLSDPPQPLPSGLAAYARTLRPVPPRVPGEADPKARALARPQSGGREMSSETTRSCPKK